MQKVTGSLCVCLYRRISLTTDPKWLSLDCSFSWVLGRFISILGEVTFSFKNKGKNGGGVVELPYVFEYPKRPLGAYPKVLIMIYMYIYALKNIIRKIFCRNDYEWLYNFCRKLDNWIWNSQTEWDNSKFWNK